MTQILPIILGSGEPYVHAIVHDVRLDGTLDISGLDGSGYTRLLTVALSGCYIPVANPGMSRIHSTIFESLTVAFSETDAAIVAIRVMKHYLKNSPVIVRFTKKRDPYGRVLCFIAREDDCYLDAFTVNEWLIRNRLAFHIDALRRRSAAYLCANVFNREGVTIWSGCTLDGTVKVLISNPSEVQWRMPESVHTESLAVLSPRR